MEDELIIRGTLEESSMPELLRSICQNMESGILTCSVNEYMKSVYINEGQIIFANSTNLDDRLGESLLRSGKITVRHFLDGSKMVRPGRRLGAILCEINAITPEELMDGIRNQVRDIIISLFEASKGKYELVLKEVDTHEMIRLGMSTEDIIFDGVKSIDSWSRISQGIGSFNARLMPSEAADKILLNLSLTPEESHLFSLCQKGQFTVEDVCGMSYLTSFETCRILWAFLTVGALVAKEPVQAKAGEIPAYVPTSVEAELDLHDLVESYNDLYSHIYDYTYQKIGDEAEELAGKAMLQVRDSMPSLAKDLKLDTYGRLDFDAVLKNLGPVPESGRMELVTGALEEIVYALLFEIGTFFGPADQKKLTKEIQGMRKR